jgi:hypothetical protein
MVPGAGTICQVAGFFQNGRMVDGYVLCCKADGCRAVTANRFCSSFEHLPNEASWPWSVGPVEYSEERDGGDKDGNWGFNEPKGGGQANTTKIANSLGPIDFNWTDAIG